MRAFTVKLSDVQACPIHSLAAEHYREDGSCHCDPSTHPRTGELDREWHEKRDV